MIIAFDVDGTLLDADDRPYKDIVGLLKKLAAIDGVEVIVWSGGGKQYAETWVRRFGLESLVKSCHSKLEASQLSVDIAIDDMPSKIARVNLQIARSDAGELLFALH